MTLELALLIAMVFISIFAQSLAGFGVGLIAMPLLIPLMGIEAARPLMALITLVSSIMIVIRYRTALSLGSVGAITIAALIGVPVGEWILNVLDEKIITIGLGVTVVGYALYAWFTPRLPTLTRTLWDWPVGFLSGILSGAYNTGGPPLVMYGTARGWPPAEFKGNLQGHSLIKSLAVILTHLLAGNITPRVMVNFAWTIPAILIASLVAFSLDHWIDPVRFQKIVLIVLFLSGAKLLIG
jgi:hypothetical protein